VGLESQIEAFIACGKVVHQQEYAAAHKHENAGQRHGLAKASSPGTTQQTLNCNRRCRLSRSNKEHSCSKLAEARNKCESGTSEYCRANRWQLNAPEAL
jgi:hypothetical protein